MELKSSRVKRILKDGGVCFGSMLRILKTSQAVSLFASAGWDFIIVDTEHNDYNSETISNLSLLSKYEDIDLFVRVPDKLYHLLAVTLDIGADGLVLPQVKTAEEAQKIIEFSKYKPIGKRGVSISGNVSRFRDIEQAEYTKLMNQELVTIIQIESEEGIGNLSKILSLGEIDAIMIGPADLSQDMGIPGEIHHSRVEAAFQEIITCCNKYGVAPGVHLSDLEHTRHWINKGMRFITYGYDIKFIKDSISDSIYNLHNFLDKN